MKKFFLLVCICASSMAANAQINLGKIVNAVAGNSATANAITSIAENLLGTASVDSTSLVGTWVYQSPCLALESENALANMGGSVVAAPVEKKLTTIMEKVGMKPGQVTLVFSNDGNLTAQMGKTTPITAQWKVEGNTLILSKNMMKTISVKCNVKMTASGMQLAVESKKLMSLISTLCSNATAYSSTIGAAGMLLNNYQGVQIGMKFQKQ